VILAENIRNERSKQLKKITRADMQSTINNNLLQNADQNQEKQLIE